MTTPKTQAISTSAPESRTARALMVAPMMTHVASRVTHVCGLFRRETWIRGLDAAGFDIEVVEPRFEDEPSGQVVFARRCRA